MGGSCKLRKGLCRRELPVFVRLHGDLRHCVADHHQRPCLRGSLRADAGHQGDERVPDGLLHAEPHWRHRAGLHLEHDLRRHSEPLRNVDSAQHKDRLLGAYHPHVLAADRLYDDHLHCRTSGCAGGYAGGREDRRREQVADALEGHDPERDAVHYDLHVPDAYQRL